MNCEVLADMVDGASFIIDMTQVNCVRVQPTSSDDKFNVIFSAHDVNHRFVVKKEQSQNILNVWVHTRINKSFDFCLYIIKNGEGKIATDIF